MRNSVAMYSKDKALGYHSVQEKEEPEVEETENKTT